MLIETILTNCDTRYSHREKHQCPDCSYGIYCPSNCERCLHFIHTPSESPNGAPKRKYDCTYMADYYTCKYSCRYTSEMIHAFTRLKDLKKLSVLKVLSFGCGPCTDLFALDYLLSQNQISFKSLEYQGVDYSENVWKNIHKDISTNKPEYLDITFHYQDACTLINKIAISTWTPNLIVFQYVFSDMQKHTGSQKTKAFIDHFSHYFNERITNKSYIVLNDINLGIRYKGGREYFDYLHERINNSKAREGRFSGYHYGEDSDGEFKDNRNFFDLAPWRRYSPFTICKSAQMLIKKEIEE